MNQVSRALEIAAVVSVIIILGVLYLYRRKRLKEDHAILWLFVAASIFVMSTATDLLLFINSFVGATSIPDLVLAAFVAFLIMMGIYYSVKISELTEQNKRLAQEIALLKAPASTSTEKDEEKRA